MEILKLDIHITKRSLSGRGPTRQVQVYSAQTVIVMMGGTESLGQGVTRPEISQPSVHACMCSEQGAEDVGGRSWGLGEVALPCIADHHCNLTFKSLSLLRFSLPVFSLFLSLPHHFRKLRNQQPMHECQF